MHFYGAFMPDVIRTAGASSFNVQTRSEVFRRDLCGEVYAAAQCVDFHFELPIIFLTHMVAEDCRG